MRFLRWFFSGEVVFAGFLFSSVFKGIFNTPLDLTLLFFVLSLFVALKRIFIEQNLPKISIFPLFIYTGLSLLIIVSLLYTTSNVYGFEKMARFISITAWSFGGVFILIRNYDSLIRFLKGLLLYGCLTVMHVSYNYFSAGVASGRIGIDGENVLGLGRIAAITSIIISVFFFYQKKKLTHRAMSLILFGLSIIVLLLTGSRMPFLSLIVTMFILFLLSISYDKSRKILISKKIFPFIILCFIGSISLIPLYFNGMFITMFDRLSKLLDQSLSGSEIAGRSVRFQAAIEMWKNKPIFGNGIGSFSTHYKGLDVRSYPHNIFLETLSELGIIGMIFLLFLFVVALISIFRLNKIKMNVGQVSIILILFYLFLNANSTGDFNDNRLLFTFVSLSIMIPLYYDNTHNYKEGHP